MRLSCRKEDPGYDAEAIIKDWEILCDSKVVECVVTADEEQGIIVCYERTSEGDFKEVVLRGKVEIREA